MVDEYFDFVKHLDVRNIVSTNILLLVLLCQLELIHIFVNIEEALEVPQCIIGLLFTNTCSDSSFAADNVASVIDQQLPSLVRTGWFSALKDASVVHHLKLLQEKFCSILDVLLRDDTLTLFIWTDGALFASIVF